MRDKISKWLDIAAKVITVLAGIVTIIEAVMKSR